MATESKKKRIWEVLRENSKRNYEKVASQMRKEIEIYDKETHKGVVRIAGKEYPCEVIDGVRYIDGMTVSEFMETLDTDTLIKLAKIGKTAIEFEKAGVDFPAQKTLNSLEQNNESKMS